jgi:hypothetical protein
VFTEQQPLPGEELGVQEAGVGGGVPPWHADSSQAYVLGHVGGEEVAGDLADKIRWQVRPVPLLFLYAAKTTSREYDSP